MEQERLDHMRTDTPALRAALLETHLDMQAKCDAIMRTARLEQQKEIDNYYMINRRLRLMYHKDLVWC